MEYFVSAENTPYYHWQLELLIESFKQNNCEDQLLVALAAADAPTHNAFCRNLLKHKNVYAHQNIGELRGYKALNEIYAVSWSLDNQMLKQPFAQISADVVLRRPLTISFNNAPEIIFDPDPFFTIEAAEDAIGPFWEWIDKSKEDYSTKWVPIGPIMIFNNIPSLIFQRTITIAESLALQQLLAGKPIWEHTKKLAWAINLSDYVGQIQLRGDYTLAMNMLSNGGSPFIHYEHGLPPVFNKTMFQYSPPNFVSFGDPFEVLAANFPTPASHFISQLAQSNLAARVE
jgi:hypothetical protein